MSASAQDIIDQLRKAFTHLKELSEELTHTADDAVTTGIDHSTRKHLELAHQHATHLKREVLTALQMAGGVRSLEPEPGQWRVDHVAPRSDHDLPEGAEDTEDGGIIDSERIVAEGEAFPEGEVNDLTTGGEPDAADTEGDDAGAGEGEVSGEGDDQHGERNG